MSFHFTWKQNDIKSVLFGILLTHKPENVSSAYDPKTKTAFKCNFGFVDFDFDPIILLSKMHNVLEDQKSKISIK